ncbi:hypothetical protein ONS95_014089 [Cadophora gregata]|uniref:uncharacterized protein n=1 Tax=Cadophora gregata TaxID=51156 RepID=UPI0026DB7575|nr:uncharacterized protein ONS95_014089 [Cadophora gregata]KAK0113842.1 hypothetical protein ONS96_014695 [Cadophora gregata f. sp. sojae]KAK0114604.1 hypothetical protein ONS95_014089 [Cadophora gregata]
MKGFTTILVCSLAALVASSPARGDRAKAKAAAAAAAAAAAGGAGVAAGTGATNGNSGNGAGNGAGNAATGGSVTRGADTIVMTEIGGIPGNECLTFRNNGEIVDAACVNEAADRQVTPSTNAAGVDVLLVQRSFTAGFRPDLVDVQACIGFNGTTMKAVDCAGSDEMVSIVGGQLTSTSGACQSGHDDKAQLTVDPTGANCVGVTTTTVTPTAP